MTTKISNLKKGIKEWWRLNWELLRKKAKCSSVPPVRDEGRWVNDSKGKAALTTKSFDAKAKLPDEVADCNFDGHPDAEYDDFIALCSRHTLKLPQDLNKAKATGPDKIPASILQRIAKFIAAPFTMVCRRLLI